jgi:hypothetical protein
VENFWHKPIAIMNKDIAIGVAMNAFAVLGLNNKIESEKLRLGTYQDNDGNLYPNISYMPFIILRGKLNEIKKVIHAAK